MKRVKITGTAFTTKNVNIILKPDLTKPNVIQEIVSRGLARKYFAVGDEIPIPWTDDHGDEPVDYQYPFIVADISDVQDANNATHRDALWLMAKYAAPNFGISFDTTLAIRVDTSVEPLADTTKWFYYTSNKGEYSRYYIGNGEALPTNITIYKSIESGAASAKSGKRFWANSNIRQWLNSNAEKNEGWYADLYEGDTGPSETIQKYPGFISGFPDKWKQIFKPVRVETIREITGTGISTETTYDTFFIPSVEQVYGEPYSPSVTEGKAWEYWINATGLEQPDNGSSSEINQARIIKPLENPEGDGVRTSLRTRARVTFREIMTLNNGYIYNYSNSDRHLPVTVLY